MTMGSRSDVDDDYDVFKPFFFESDIEEELYDSPPAPSEDIWKKFELLPTPPRSPKHEPIYGNTVLPSTLDKLHMVSDLLDDPCSQTYVYYDESDSESNLKSNLIQDCMWSGLNLRKEILEAATTTNTAPTHAKHTLRTDSSNKCKTTYKSCGSTNNSSSLDINSTDCVDPAAVFPYPLNEQTPARVTAHRLGTDTPSDSEEDEEIDVVTVNEKSQVIRRKPVLPGANTMSAQVAAMHNYSNSQTTQSSPRSSPQPRQPLQRITIQQNTVSPGPQYRQKRSRTHGHHSHHPPIKKIRISLSQAGAIHKYSRSGYSSSSQGGDSRSSSDSEDSEGRRAQHNVLERKRRDDLKYSFLRLRDAVPELSAQDKAAKVVILKKASIHIHHLKRTHNSLVSELDHQKRTHEQLKRRLSQLQKSAQ